MTLIGRFTFSGYPVLFGDILLSRNDNAPHHPITVPSLNDINANLDDSAWGYAAGTVQKLNIVNDNLMIAWAGDFLQARHAVRHLDDAVQKGASTSQDAFRALSEIETETADISLTGLIVRPDGRPNGVHVASFNLDMETHTINGIDVRLAGTGSWHASELLPHIINPSVHSQPVEQAIYNGVALSGALIGQEMNTPGILGQMWGGALEIGFVANGRLQKLDRVLHLQLRVRHAGQNMVEMSLWPKLVHYRYLGSYLYVSTFEAYENGPAKEERFLIGPLLKDENAPIELAIEVPDWSYEYLCCFIAFDQGLSNSGYTVIAIRSSENQIGIARDGKTIGLRYDPELFRQLT